MSIDYKKLAKALFLVLLALISALYFGNDDSLFANATETKIEARIDDALVLSSASAISSVAVTLLPGDIATPVAEKMADLTEYFIIALLFLYTEKFLMAVLGFGVFKVIVPATCLILAALLYRKNEKLKKLVLRAALFSMMVFASIPISTRISDTIYSRYAVNIDEVVNAATSVTVSEEDGVESSKGVLDIVSEKISGVTASFTNKVGALLHSFIDILAVTVVSSCVIPLLVLAFLLWLLNKLFGLKVFLSDPKGGKPAVLVKKGWSKKLFRKRQESGVRIREEQPNTEQIIEQDGE